MLNFLHQLQSFSIRTKFTLSLLLVTFVSVSVVGWVAYSQLMTKFNQVIAEDASQRFSMEVAAYIKLYGSWDEAVKHESFRSFSERNGPVIHRHPIGIGLSPEVTRKELDTPKFHQSTIDRPPFRFYLFDTEYRTLMSLEPFPKGSRVSEEIVAQSQPIQVNGKVVAYYVPQGKPNYSALDKSYLQAIEKSLLLGTGVAAVVALVLGVLLGNTLSKGLRRLTRAVEAMDADNLLQQVKIESKDEVGILANAINKMSERIFNINKDLRLSHDEVERQAAQLRELSIRDELTQLYNRRYFGERSNYYFAQAVRYQRAFTVMIGDIDFFKKINDQYSHDMGDEVLRKISAILSTKVRNTDLVARYGGEEFVIAFPETTLEQAAICCEELRKRVEDYPWHTLDPDLKVTMSMGLSADIKAGNVESMLREADALLYRAKHEGRNRVCV